MPPKFRAPATPQGRPSPRIRTPNSKRRVVRPLTSPESIKAIDTHAMDVLTPSPTHSSSSSLSSKRKKQLGFNDPETYARTASGDDTAPHGRSRQPSPQFPRSRTTSSLRPFGGKSRDRSRSYGGASDTPKPKISPRTLKSQLDRAPGSFESLTRRRPRRTEPVFGLKLHGDRPPSRPGSSTGTRERMKEEAQDDKVGPLSRPRRRGGPFEGSPTRSSKGDEELGMRDARLADDTSPSSEMENDVDVVVVDDDEYVEEIAGDQDQSDTNGAADGGVATGIQEESDLEVDIDKFSGDDLSPSLSVASPSRSENDLGEAVWEIDGDKETLQQTGGEDEAVSKRGIRSEDVDDTDEDVNEDEDEGKDEGADGEGAPGQEGTVELDTMKSDKTEEVKQEREAEEVESGKTIPASSTSKALSKGSSSSRKISYKKGNMIGQGSLGRVFLAFNRNAGTFIAVKEVEFAGTMQQVRERLAIIQREINLMSHLDHPNIVRYLGTERVGRTLNIFLEYVPGGSISQCLAKFGRFDECVIRGYARQLLEGMSYLHKHRIIHRDIKGANILLECTGGIIKLADFGASRELASMSMRMTDPRYSLIGTPSFMSPEVVKQTGHGTPADIWSFGCTILEMYTGRPPWGDFRSVVVALLHIAQSKTGPPIPDSASQNLRSFLQRCFAVDPKERATADELLVHPFITENVDDCELRDDDEDDERREADEKGKGMDAKECPFPVCAPRQFKRTSDDREEVGGDVAKWNPTDQHESFELSPKVPVPSGHGHTGDSDDDDDDVVIDDDDLGGYNPMEEPTIIVESDDVETAERKKDEKDETEGTSADPLFEIYKSLRELPPTIHGPSEEWNAENRSETVTRDSKSSEEEEEEGIREEFAHALKDAKSPPPKPPRTPLRERKKKARSREDIRQYAKSLFEERKTHVPAKLQPQMSAAFGSLSPVAQKFRPSDPSFPAGESSVKPSKR
eukprot:TRINITY_DN15584_c0_g1_i3.p1 TRINITY_DN15584_c0_g1~~TRINITY_DN15584_c0_g1_i3.p1  ORF type:complete len:967 (-),score=282.53 TRINITY_DN15584_c0_g1_i3:2128-5028(-)